MAVNLQGGKLVRLDQMGSDKATKSRMENGLYLNRLKYAAEAADMEKMLTGIKSVDIITGWDPDDYVQASFTEDEFAALLRRHCEAIQNAADNTIDLKASLAGYTENRNSTLSTANPLVARGARYDYNLILTHLYYKGTNSEDLDLAFAIGSPGNERFHFTYDAPIIFTLCDGSELRLLQTRDDVNFVCVYPTLEEVFRLANAGVKSVTITCEDGSFTDEFAPREDGALSFSDAVNQELQLLLSLSPR